MSCEYCRRIPHHPRCPMADEPPIIGECTECGVEIHEGDDYFDFDGKLYCEPCVYDKRRTAEVD